MCLGLYHEKGNQLFSIGSDKKKIEYYQDVYSRYLYNLTLCKKEKKRYYLARIEVDNNLSNMELSYNDTHEILTINLLKKDKYVWKSERPPLTWYAAALAAMHLQMNFSPELACDLAKACNYYGDFDISKKMARYALKKLPSNYNRIHFEAIKQLSKAYKNEGNFEESRIVLREAISKYKTQNDSTYLAYIYLLFAKLCNDYQQRQGWYQEFHKIAKEKMNRSPEASEKWKILCEESYGKACFESNPEESIKICSRLILNSTASDDSYIRRKAHLLEAKILYALWFFRKICGCSMEAVNSQVYGIMRYP